MNDPQEDRAPDAVASRRERKKQATRDALRAAALELFAVDGFTAVTVEQICDRADVAPSTFFRHFDAKEDVVLSGLVGRGSELLDALAAQPVDVTPRELLLGALDAWQVGRRPAEVLRSEVVLLAGEEQLLARLDRVLVTWERPVADLLGARYGAGPVSLEARLGAGWFVATMRTVIRDWALGGGEDDVYVLGRRALARLATAVEDLFEPDVATS